MHHPNSVSRFALGSLLLGLWLGSTVVAQEVPKEPPAPKGGAMAPPSSGIIVPIGGTQRVQMRTRRNIATVVNSRPVVARVQPVANDPTAVLVTGQEAGVTQLTLTDEKGERETIEVVVQFDVEYIRTLLQRAVPTASIQPIASGSNTIILTGNVAHQEDIDVVMRTAASVLGGPERVINAMRVGGVMQVQLDVAVARVSRTKIRRMAFDFINFGQHHIFASTVGGGFQIPAQPLTGTFPGSGITVPNSVGLPNGVPSNLFLALFNPEQDFFGAPAFAPLLSSTAEPS